MEATIIDGKAKAAAIKDTLKNALEALNPKRRPCLSVIIVGNDPASEVYVSSKAKQAKALGMESRLHTLSATSSEAELLALVEKENQDPLVDGILVQMPLPKGMDAAKVIDTIDPAKDVDGFHIQNAGSLFVGKKGMVPCTPWGCLLLLRDALGDLSGKHAVVLGRSNIVGKPMAQLLLQANCTVTIAHSRTKNLPIVTQQADIVVAACGVPRLVTAEHLRPGATVIDVGIHREEGGLCGDVDFGSCKNVAGAITKVPGGVGPMTIACLMLNTFVAFCLRENLTIPDSLSAFTA